MKSFFDSAQAHWGAISAFSVYVLIAARAALQPPSSGGSLYEWFYDFTGIFDKSTLAPYRAGRAAGHPETLNRRISGRNETNMTIFATLSKWEHTFTGWMAKEWKKVYAAEPEIQAIADTTFKYAIPALSIVAGSMGGAPAAALVTSVLTEAQRDLHAVSGLIFDFGPSPQVSSILGAVQSNLGGLLTDAHVTSTKSVDGVTKVMNTLQALQASVEAELAPAKA